MYQYNQQKDTIYYVWCELILRVLYKRRAHTYSHIHIIKSYDAVCHNLMDLAKFFANFV